MTVLVTGALGLHQALIAEAQIDLRRVRYAGHQLLSRLASDLYYETRADKRQKEADKRHKEKVLLRFMRKNALVPALAALEALEQCDRPLRLEGPHKIAMILLEEAKELVAMDRYERRALSRRKFAIRACDAVRRQRPFTIEIQQPKIALRMVLAERTQNH